MHPFVKSIFAKNSAKNGVLKVDFSIFLKKPEKTVFSRLDFFKFLQIKRAIFDANSIDTITNDRVHRVLQLSIHRMQQTKRVFEKIKLKKVRVFSSFFNFAKFLSFCGVFSAVFDKNINKNTRLYKRVLL